MTVPAIARFSGDDDVACDICGDTGIITAMGPTVPCGPHDGCREFMTTPEHSGVCTCAAGQARTTPADTDGDADALVAALMQGRD